MATGLFDDLIPQTPKATSGAFDDLIPASGLRSRTPEQQALEQEIQEPTLEKLGVRAALGAGEEGKGGLRVAIGNVLDWAGKHLHPYTYIRNQQAERGETSPEPVSTYIRSLGQSTAELGRENIQEARELGEGVGGGKAGDIVQALGTTFTVSAPAIPAAILGGIPAAAATAGATQFGSSMDQFRQQLIQRGNTPEEAERKATLPAMLAGGITATLTRVIPGGAEMLLNRVAAGETAQGVGRFLGKLISREIPLEMTEEGADQIGQSIVERVMVNPNKTLEETVKETVFAMGAAGLLTTIIGGTAAGTMKAAETAGSIAEDVSFRRRSRRIADVQARLGMTPQGRTTATERTYDTQERQPILPAQQEGQELGRAIPVTQAGSQAVETGGVPQAPPIDPSTFIVSVQAPQGEVPGNVQIIDPAQGERDRSPTVESLRAAGVQVPDFQSLPQGQYPYPEAVRLLQGDRRSPQQAPPLTEGTVPIPAAPPAVQLPPIGRFEIPGTPAEQYETVLQTIRNANANTKAKVQALFPKAQLSREQAGELRSQAFPNISFSMWEEIDTSTEPQAISRPEIDSLVREFQAAYPNTPRIIVADNKRDLEVLTGQRFPQNDPAAAIVRSPVTGNTVFLVADHITSPDRLKALLAHEAIGHHGVESVMRGDFRALALAVEQKLRGTDQWRDIADRYGGRGRTFGAEDNVIFGSELMARMSEGNIQDLSLWEQIVAFIRKWWREHVSRTNPISDAEIRKALVDARKFLQGQGQVARPATGTSFAEEPAPPEENPFDRMRRESGAEPPPELIPEQQAARDRNEKQRGMRPNPLTSFALEPAELAASENGDDVYVPTYLAGTQDNIRDRTQVTTESTTQSQQHAKKVFDEAGVPVEWLEHTPANPVTGSPSKGIWKYVKQPNEEAGRKLVVLLERELKKELTDDNVLLMGSLINSVRYNDKLGNAEGVFDLPTRKALYALSQAQASIRGALLQELRQHPAIIEDLVRNVDLVLHRVWHDAFGGEVIDGVMTDIRRGVQSFMTRPLIEHVLAQNPTLQGSLDLVTALSDNQKALPDAATLLEQIFQTPFYKLSDFSKALENRLVKEYGVDPKEAAKVAREFQNAFDPSLKQGATEALKIAMSNLTYEKKAKVKGKKSIEKLVQEAIDKGALESGEVLRKIAKDNHWRPPTDDQINQMKKLSDRMRFLKTLPDKQLAEMRKTGASDQDIENARKIREEGLASEINRVRREMEIAWSRMTKPISIWYGLPFFGDPDIRANNARAINEFIAANLLSKPGFFTRQVAAILSQWLSFVPTRSIANAMVNNQHAVNWKERQPFIKEVASQLRDGYKQQFASMKSALAAAQAGLLGRGEARSVMNLTAALSALDRLTKAAEERWAAGDYGRASLLYFMSSIKMGYRIAQGLDRLQGVPAHYQNMRAQVVRKLMDNGKTRAEADTSADQVMDIIKQEWALALVRARDLLTEADAKVTPQRIRQGAANIVKRKAYQKLQEIGLGDKADDFESENTFLENTLGWNQREVKGVGGALARGLRQAERVAESYGVPLVATRFSNAIGITINRALGYTPFWKQANVGGPGESAWFKSEVDRAQRRVDAYVGTSLGAIALMLALTGTWAVRLRWPKDREERDLFEREGHRPNTVEIPVSDTEFLAISLNNSPMMFVAPYLAAGAALREKLDEKAKRQAVVDAQAAELGVTAEKVPGLSAGDMVMVALAAGQQAILGGRTVSGLIGSMTTYGTPSAKKTVASYTSAMIPWLPAGQEMSRMAGVSLDEKAATIGDLMLPLPTSGARKLNLLGDPVRTPNDIQRVTQILTGGTSLVPVDAADAKTEAAYRALIESGYRPPSVNPGQGYLIDGTIRPMRHDELIRYTQARGSALKEALAGFAATGDAEQDKALARKLYQQANTQALQSINAAPVPRYSSGSATTTPRLPQLPRVTRPRSGLRRTARGRSRIRRLRTRSTRRIRGFRSVRLAA